ncbi:hypothetical protein K432DRAFT_421283 [Lepidopterella palustris CBS 459.81]|uniref:gamma-glutamylcyclotransferase n=1 Tax=Lepidopterella palustris CBS 459.81 TaxID=1314670 RepID=A0A8E2ELA5_9PEZI|nr:hypothetical protein K432DRAFT_421283 [Lepidopterella palustris CBS 459.81]
MNDKDESSCWYFAYGSNMSASVFTTRRKIQPLETEVACIKSHTLCFNIMGVPYSDPGMGGLRKINKGDDTRIGPVVGVAYRLSREEFGRVIASEGGGIAYKVVKLAATFEKDGSTAPVYTLIGRHDIDPSYERLPSPRYMGLLIRGARELNLPQSYQEKLASQLTFRPPQSLRYTAGKWSFDAFWKRVQYCIEQGVRTFKDDEGHVPAWFLTGFDCLLWTMWIHHDYVHSKIWGRGDGR